MSFLKWIERCLRLCRLPFKPTEIYSIGFSHPVGYKYFRPSKNVYSNASKSIPLKVLACWKLIYKFVIALHSSPKFEDFFFERPGGIYGRGNSTYIDSQNVPGRIVCLPSLDTFEIRQNASTTRLAELMWFRLGVEEVRTKIIIS
jgi:hypothetical protein